MWLPLHCHSHFSLLDGLSKPEQIAERIAECGYSGCALTDHGTCAGVPSFFKAMTKRSLKPIAGCEFYICQQDANIREKSNSALSHLCVLAKDAEGWKRLIQATSCSNRPEYFYRKPRLSLEQLASFSEGHFIAFSGHMGSELANVIFEDPRAAYRAESVAEAKAMAHKDWPTRVFDLIRKYQSLFGKENFGVEIQLIDRVNLPASEVVALGLRWAAKKLGAWCLATSDSHYPRQEDAEDQRIILCAAMDTTLKEVQRKQDNEEDVGLGAFFKSNNYHIPSLEEMQALHTQEELANAVSIADRCEVYKIGGKPMLPVFECPDGKKPDDYMKELCESGWKKRIEPILVKHPDKRQEYSDRKEKELKVLTEAGLSSYFLIVQDYVVHAKDVLKCLVGKGRGSGAGCLVSFLLRITDVDPIRFGLIFERFYNAGRNSPGRVALPDIDSDFPVAYREAVIAKIKQKYGEDKVCQMATFSRMQGRGALKDVLRAKSRCEYEEMNRITEHIPDEAAIADDLQEMFEETGEASIIRWALENNAEQLKEWCFINEKGDLDGPMACDFAQAIRLEGTKRSQGKHASGIIISSETLGDLVPMIYDKSSGQQIVGVDMRDAEDMGLVKFDILGTTVLDKIMGAQSVIRTGKVVV